MIPSNLSPGSSLTAARSASASLGRIDAASVHARVDLDEDSDRRSCPDRSGGMRGRVRRLIHRDEDPAVPGKLGEQPDLVRMRDSVDDEQVVKPAAGEDRRFPDRRHRQPARARLHLAAGEIRALVRLVMRPDCGRADSS